MKRLIAGLVLVVFLAAGAWGQNKQSATDMYGTLKLRDDIVASFGTDGDFDLDFDSATSRLKLKDAAGNLLGEMIDGGTTGNWNITGQYQVGGAQLDSDDLSDTSSIAMLDEAEIIAGNWVNTTNPWGDAEVNNDITINTSKPITVTGDLTITSGQITADADVDGLHTIGKLKLGIPTGGVADSAYLGHFDNFGDATSYAMRVTPSLTFLNVATGGTVRFKVNNTNDIQFTGTQFFPSSGTSLGRSSGRWDSAWTDALTVTNDATIGGDIDVQGGDINNTTGTIVLTPSVGNSTTITGTAGVARIETTGWLAIRSGTGTNSIQIISAKDIQFFDRDASVVRMLFDTETGNMQIDGDLDVDGNDIDIGDAGGFSGIKFDPTATEFRFFIDGTQVGHIGTDGAYVDDVP